MKKRVLFLILLVFTLKAIAGDGRKQEVDSILSKAKEFETKGEFLLQLETALNALTLSNVHNYDEGKARAHFSGANALVNVGVFKEGLKHLERVEHTKYYKEKILMQSEVHRVRGRAYTKLRLYQQAIREFRLQLTCIKGLEGDAQKISYVYTYGNLTTVFDQTEQLDSMQKYIELQLTVLRDFDEESAAAMYLGAYNDLGQLYVRKGNFVKAEDYLDKSLALVEKYKIPEFYNTLTYLGNLQDRKGNREKALAFYQESLANMREVGNRNAIKNTYRYLADYYVDNKLDKSKADEYELAFSRLNDSLEKENRQVVDMVLNQILKSKDQESATKVSKSIRISIIALALLFVVITFFVWRSRRHRRILDQKDETLQETETINRELTEQIGENKFNNLIELAKSNNPEFLTLFKELYPQFIQALKSRDPNIRSTELEFCAMAFLNFSTKNIAEYTFVTVRAVQVRKNRIRKKFEIPSDADFNNWMRGLVDTAK
ncbi:tetratricopeptide repeat protein [Sphingobacterium sp. SGR-19]|uniref:tetratricopeptide repeat protein n=1 Tax=Sphingobacterium sp. SGR-19 TaxID=2710886 RepID=UPI0013EC36BF|nr:tetratricopeptide repeat protein [Sphingobacterium sp. SGR-19]NGM66821.1 tetratricopeptide repeat protein [Sphingobacterium sp. SGR-19]